MLVPHTGVYSTVIQKVAIRIVISSLIRYNIFRQIVKALDVARSVTEKEIYSE
jgi:hypothetical protein